MLRVDSDAGERGVADGGRTDRHRTISHGQDPLSFNVNTLMSPHKRDEFHRQSEMNKSEDRLSVTEEDEEEDEVDMDNDSDDQSDTEPHSGMSAGARSPRVAHPGHDRTPSAHATATKPPLRSSSVWTRFWRNPAACAIPRRWPRVRPSPAPPVRCACPAGPPSAAPARRCGPLPARRDIHGFTRPISPRRPCHRRVSRIVQQVVTIL